MNEYELPDEIYWQQKEREEAEQHHKELLNNCKHDMILVEMEERWIRGMAYWFALFYCKHCEIYEQLSVDQDDYLAWQASKK